MCLLLQEFPVLCHDRSRGAVLQRLFDVVVDVHDVRELRRQIILLSNGCCIENVMDMT